MSFDRLAPFYRTMEWALAGQKLQRCRTEWLPEAMHTRRALLVGEGPGRFLEVCAPALPQAEILCVDASAGMLKQAQNCWPKKLNQVRFCQGSLPSWQPPRAQFDLIVTHFFFDCFPPDQLGQVVSQLAGAATPDARWLLADFCEPPAGWRRWRARLILGLAYAFFRVVTRLPARSLAAPDPFLKAAGFQLKRRRTYDWGLLHSDLWVR